MKESGAKELYRRARACLLVLYKLPFSFQVDTNKTTQPRITNITLQHKYYKE